jgi:hypothetical protein
MGAAFRCPSLCAALAPELALGRTTPCQQAQQCTRLCTPLLGPLCAQRGDGSAVTARPAAAPERIARAQTGLALHRWAPRDAALMQTRLSTPPCRTRAGPQRARAGAGRAAHRLVGMRAAGRSRLRTTRPGSTSQASMCFTTRPLSCAGARVLAAAPHPAVRPRCQACAGERARPPRHAVHVKCCHGLAARIGR